ncbi:hypothetical protein AB0N77_20450 [Streptomyces misionensis]|uniref:hypothetical protein n=1 Tax=Streptomyces misionensis TaxID=67331 RepID=UPI0034420B62
MNLVQQYAHLDFDAVQALSPRQISAYLRSIRWVRADTETTSDMQTGRGPTTSPPGHLPALHPPPARRAYLIWPGWVSSPTRRRHDYAAHVEKLLLLLGFFERRLASDAPTDIARGPAA